MPFIEERGPIPDNAHQPTPARVTVVDFDMPFGSMVAFIFKWALASIPAICLLCIAGGAIFFALTVLFAGIRAASNLAPVLPSSLSFSDSSVPATSGSSALQALVVSVRRDGDAFEVINESNVVWRMCSLTLSGRTASVAELPSQTKIMLASSAFNGTLPDPLTTEAAVECRAPERRTGRVYVLGGQ